MSKIKSIALLAFLSLSLLGSVWADEVIPKVEPAGLIAPWRFKRVGLDMHKSFGSAEAEKKQGYGLGLVALFPLTESGFDIGARYASIGQEVNSYTLLTFIFDYYIFPSVVQGIYLGGEIGLTDSNATSVISIYNDYVFVGKIGYEYWLKGTAWSTAVEIRRMMKSSDPIKQTTESRIYANGMLLSVRYSF